MTTSYYLTIAKQAVFKLIVEAKSNKLIKMFIDFFYKLKDAGIPVSPTSFLTLHKALARGLIQSLGDFYTASRAILVKSERYFDLYDQMFAHYFEGAEMPDIEGVELDQIAKSLLEEWLKNPKEMADALGVDESVLKKLSPDELLKEPHNLLLLQEST